MKRIKTASGQLAIKQFLFLCVLCSGCSYLDHDTSPFGSSGRGQQGVIAFASERNSQPDIFVMNADGSRPFGVAPARGRDHSPAWMPLIGFETRETAGLLCPRQGGPNLGF